MPHSVEIDGLYIDDKNHLADYTGPYIFTNPAGTDSQPLAQPHPYPYTPCLTLSVRNVQTASQRRLQVTPAPQWATNLIVEGVDV